MESPYYEMTHDIEEEHRSFQSGYIKGYNDAMMKFPSMLVRCKDCVYHENEKARSNQTAWLPCMEIQTKNNWYCADGVKKDE